MASMVQPSNNPEIEEYISIVEFVIIRVCKYPEEPTPKNRLLNLTMEDINANHLYQSFRRR